MGSNRVCFLCSSLGLFLHWFSSTQPRPHLLAVAVRSWQKYHKGVCRLFSLLYGYFEVGTKLPEEKSDCNLSESQDASLQLRALLLSPLQALHIANLQTAHVPADSGHHPLPWKGFV